MRLVFWERLVLDVATVNPCVAFASKFAVDVTVAEPDTAQCAAVAIGALGADFHVLTEHLVGQCVVLVCRT